MPRGATLACLLLAVLAVNLGTTVVNVALPSLVRELHASTTLLQWIVDPYSLVFASLLLAAGSVRLPSACSTPSVPCWTKPLVGDAHNDPRRLIRRTRLALSPRAIVNTGSASEPGLGSSYQGSVGPAATAAATQRES